MAALSGVKQKQLIEMVQQHHPLMGETEIRKLLNKAQDIVCEDTDILERWFTDTTVADQRYYDLDASILRIQRVELSDDDGNYWAIPRMQGIPSKGDDA